MAIAKAEAADEEAQMCAKAVAVAVAVCCVPWLWLWLCATHVSWHNCVLVLCAVCFVLCAANTYTHTHTHTHAYALGRPLETARKPLSRLPKQRR